MHVGAGLVQHQAAAEGVEFGDRFFQPQKELIGLVRAVAVEVLAAAAVDDGPGQRRVALEDVGAAVTVVHVAVEDADLERREERLMSR